jgi:2,5-diamino-6-(ribosylamino)-4(3H)-pyrimidinone 5'-phosphate reductase
MLPRIVLHNAISLDAHVTGFPANVGLFYGLISRWQEDATLIGSETLLAATPADADDCSIPPATGPDDSRPLLVAVDSRGRLGHWAYWRSQPYWRDIVVLCSRATPQAYADDLARRGIACLVSGEKHVDLRVALEGLNARYGVRTVRVDSGGTLNGALLRAGLVDEVSVLIHPHLVGGTTPRSLFQAPDLTPEETSIRLRLDHVEQMTGDIVWLRYQVVK